MAFTIDKQTLDDLNLPGKFKNNSIFSLFNTTHTRGGEILLEQMFSQPLTDATAINRRAQRFAYFGQKQMTFPVKKELLETVEHYLSRAAHPNRYVALLNTCRRKFLNYIATDKEYEIICTGLIGCVGFLNTWKDFNNTLDDDSAYEDIRREIQNILAMPALAGLLEKKDITRLSWWEMARYDHLLRATCLSQLKRLMDIVYETDIYLAVSHIARQYHFTAATAYSGDKKKKFISVKGLFHPRLPEAVTNDMEITPEQNVVFLTGANMAGKSTFMKSFAITVYLGHMGFPVAAREMSFTVQDGLYTSINVSDNLNLGYSHFYAEVLRVKHIAREVAAGKNLVVIFDELFKGTNVKDAYDATVAVTEAFSAHRNCSFIISTHITEAGTTLQQRCSNFRFVYLPTVMEGSRPTYTYRLAAGITDDRHGMMIIRNEGIVEIINR